MVNLKDVTESENVLQKRVRVKTTEDEILGDDSKEIEVCDVYSEPPEIDTTVAYTPRGFCSLNESCQTFLRVLVVTVCIISVTLLLILVTDGTAPFTNLTNTAASIDVVDYLNTVGNNNTFIKSVLKTVASGVSSVSRGFEVSD